MGEVKTDFSLRPACLACARATRLPAPEAQLMAGRSK